MATNAITLIAISSDGEVLGSSHLAHPLRLRQFQGKLSAGAIAQVAQYAAWEHVHRTDRDPACARLESEAAGFERQREAYRRLVG